MTFILTYNNNKMSGKR